MGTKWAKIKRYWNLYPVPLFLILKFINFTNLVFKLILRLFSDVHVDLHCYITHSMAHSFLNYSQWNIHICQDRNMCMPEVMSCNLFIDFLPFGSPFQVLISIINVKGLLLAISLCCLVDSK